MNEQLLWKDGYTKAVYKCRIFSVNEVSSISPEGKNGTYYTLSAPDWAIVMPIVRNPNCVNRFVMVKQWRHGSKELSLEFPGGVIESDEEPATAASRELLEETGWKADKIILLGDFNPNPAIMTNRVYIFSADCTHQQKSRHLDEDEFIDTELIPIDVVRRGMGKKPFIHALMAAALCLFDASEKNPLYKENYS